MCNSVCRGQNSGERIKLYKWHLLEHEIQFKNTLKVNAHGKKNKYLGHGDWNPVINQTNWYTKYRGNFKFRKKMGVIRQAENNQVK